MPRLLATLRQGVEMRETFLTFKDFHAAQQLGALGGATAAAAMLRPKLAEVKHTNSGGLFGWS
jgi:hypothetical protein